MSIKLYGYWRSSCSYRVRLGLHFKEISFENIPVHLVKDGGEQHQAEYLRRNPFGQVPALAHGDRCLTQSMAIIDYIEKAFEDPALFPHDLEGRGKVFALCEAINSGIQPLQNLAVMTRLKTDIGANDDQAKAWSAFWIEKGLKAFELMLDNTQGQFCYGDSFTAADCFLIPQVYNAKRFGIDLSQTPKIQSINQHVTSLPFAIEAHPDNQPDAQP